METPPRTLHRYLSFERGLQFIKDRRLCLSSIDAYNDPFEFFPASEESQLLSQRFFKNECSTEEIIEKLKHKQKDNCENPLVHLLHYANLEKLTGTQSSASPERSIVSLRNNTTDINKHVFFLENYFESLKKAKLCCFSEECDNILLWSHYANCHKGLAVSLDTDLRYFDKDFVKVNYMAKRVELPDNINSNSLHPNDFILTIVGTKAKFWEYEKEWRLVQYNADRCPSFWKRKNKEKIQIHYFDVEERAIKAINIGLKVKESDISNILNYRDQFLKEVEIRKAYIDDNLFKIRFKSM